MGRAFPLMAAFALAVSLAACGGPPEWTKDGVTSDVASADYADCRHDAQHAIQRDVNIDTDIAASRQHDWAQSQTTETRLADDASSNQKLSGDMVRSCMESKGYAPSGPAPTNGPHWWQIFDL
jgi:anti-sigma factor RsiW